MSKVAGPTERNNAAMAAWSMSARSSGLALKQPTVNWKAQDKYGELLLSFENESKEYIHDQELYASVRLPISMN